MAGPSEARNKWALLVGINAYPKLPVFRQLHGCVNDVEAMAGVLQNNFGFPASGITLLTDNTEQLPTRDGIVAAMDALVERVQTDDIVVFHYAGHGSRIKDREGDEPDGWDETIVPRDGGRPPEPNRDITDDEIYAWIQRLTKKTPYVTLIFDCCHSGNITRSLDGGGEGTRALEPDPRSADELPPSPMNIVSTRSAAAPEGASGWLPIGQRYVLISGCRHDELSSEYTEPEGGVRHGALTYFLSRELTSARSGASYRDVFERAAPAVTANSAEQHPQIEGARDRLLFDTVDIEPSTFVPVVSRTGNGVRLAAGSIHGMAVGADLLVYPSGTSRPDDGGEVGRITITAVRAVTCDAEVSEESQPGESVAAGCRAFEVERPADNKRLRVFLSAPQEYASEISKFSERVEAEPLLERVESASDADFRAYVIPPRGAAVDDDPVPQLNDGGQAVSEAVWAAVGPTGRLAMPTHPVARSESVGTLIDNFNKLARYRRVLDLRNPDRSSALAGKIGVTLLRKDAGDSWVPAEADDVSGEVVFEDEDLFALRIENNSEKPVYINVLDLGVTGSIGPIYEGGAKPIEPGNFLEIGVREGDERDVYMPETYPEDEGTETFLVVASSDEADLAPLFQGATRSMAMGGGGPLEQLLETAMLGSTTREARVKRPKPSEDFETVARTFTLRRKSEATALGEEGLGVDLGALTIRANGVRASAKLLPSSGGRTRSLDMSTDTLTSVLEEEQVFAAATVELQEQPTRSLDVTSPSLEVEVPDPGNKVGQFVLHIDDGGVATWGIQDPDRPTTRGAASRTYVIPRDNPSVGAGGTRGLLGTVGKHILKVFDFPLIDPVLGELGKNLANKWEAARRPYGTRVVSPDTLAADASHTVGGAEWDKLGSGRALLLLHSTVGRTHTGFGVLPRPVVESLSERYEGRVFGFDHYTLTHDPRRNVEELLNAIPDGTSLTLDVLAHGRGGLVARSLVEKLSEFNLGSRTINVGSVVFAGSPNAGTVLADPKNLIKYIDTFASVLNWIPAAEPTFLAVKTTIGGVLTVVKTLAVGASNSLTGLTAMAPGEFLDWINAGANVDGVQYRAIASEFEPEQAGLKAYFGNLVANGFLKEDNDMLVPTNSVFGENGSSLFPIDETLVLGRPDGVSHLGYFSHPKTHEKLLGWLS